MSDIIIEKTNYKALISVLTNLLLVLTFATIGTYGAIRHNKVICIPSIILAIIFFVSFLIAIVKASNEKPLLTITRDGIIDNSSHSMVGFIAYNDIEEFRITKYHNLIVIEVILKNRKEFINKLPAAKRMQIKGNALLKKPLIQIKADQAKDMEPEDIYTLLQKRLLDCSSLYD